MSQPRDPLLDRPSWAPGWLPAGDDARSLRVLRWVVGAVFVAGLAACVSEGADAPADPVLEPLASTTTTAAPTEPDGDSPSATLASRFGTVAATLEAVSGEVVELCLLHADTDDERRQGLMQVTDLEGHDGMLFSTDVPTDGAFYMFRTILPLTIAWWDEQGRFVSRADMAPCESDDQTTCERYRPAGPYRYALEVVQGSPLASHLAPGARLSVSGEACAVRS